MANTYEMRNISEIMSNDPVGASTVLCSLFAIMPEEYVIPTILTALDFWFASVGYTEAEALNIYKGMAEAAAGCYAEMGLPEIH